MANRAKGIYLNLRKYKGDVDISNRTFPINDVNIHPVVSCSGTFGKGRLSTHNKNFYTCSQYYRVSDSDQISIVHRTKTSNVGSYFNSGDKSQKLATNYHS